MKFISKIYFIIVCLLGISSISWANQNCGSLENIKIKIDKEILLTKTRVFKDGSIAVRASLAVNPDGGPASYTVGDHGFTYIANGIARWRNKQREKCDRACMKGYYEAEQLGFSIGTNEYCVFAMEVEPVFDGQVIEKCTNGKLIGNGKGKPVIGEKLTTILRNNINAYRSTTSLKHLVDGKPHYLNSEKLPIAVTPQKDLLGKVVWVNAAGMKGTFSLVGDFGPAFGEGSIALHQLLRYGEIREQKTGPISVADRCKAVELNLKPPFVSRPDGGLSDRCKKGYIAKTISDIRAYSGIDDQLDFLVLGKAIFEIKDYVIQSEVNQNSIKNRAIESGYSTEKIQQMISCLDN